MSATRARLRIGFILTCLLLVGLLTTSSLISVESALGQQPQTTQLQTLIQIAGSARSYAMTIVGTASANGLNIATAQTFLTAGNNSLLMAQLDLNSESNLTAGIQDAQNAMNDFTSASESASLALQNAGLTSSVDITSALASIAATNDTANQVSAIIVKACTTSPSNSSYAAQFQQECASGKASIVNAMFNLREAAEMLGTGQQSSIAESESLIAQAKNNVSQATAIISWLSTLTYSARVQTYLSGPFAQMMSTANASLSTQQTLIARFGTIKSSYSTVASLQTNAIGSVNTAAGATASAIALINMTSVGSNVTTEQTTLTETDTEMTQFYANLTASASLPSNNITELQNDIIAVQSAISVSNNSLDNVQSLVASFQQTTINTLPGYSAGFQTGATAEESNGQVLLSSYAKLQTDLNAIVSEFPLLLTLVQWQSTLNTQGQTLNSDTASLTSSLQSATSTLSSAVASTTTLASVVQTSATQIELNDTLVENASSIYSSESQYLNVTALSELQASVASLQLTQQMAANFVAASESLQQTNIAQFSSAVHTLATNGASLQSQAASTITAMASASAYLSSDLQIRTQALVSAKTLAEEALNLFGDQQIAQGALLMAQASAELQIVYASN